MKTALKNVSPEEYILSTLTPEERLEISFKMAQDAFKNSKLTMEDVFNSIKSVRRKEYAKKSKGSY